jgi:hypothetical protein
MDTRVIPYDTTPESLLHPETAENFFQLAPLRTAAGLCVEMARLAYVAETERLHTYLARVQFTLVQHFDHGGIQGFAADGISPEHGQVRLLSFRGTQPDEFTDLLADVQFVLQPWEPGGRVHTGFATAFIKVRETCRALTESLGRPVLLTGHSLGGALATLAVTLCPGARLYTFGSPRVGDRNFAALFSNIQHHRFVNCCDIVPRLPPTGWRVLPTLYEYRHTGMIYFVDRRRQVHGPLDELQAGRLHKAACRDIDVAALLESWRNGNIPFADLTDHAPINYVSAIS